MVVSIDAARTAVGILGNVISIILFLSPVPTFLKICKKGSVEQYSPLPYLATLINCGLWVIYGLPMVHPNSTLIVTINGAGMVIELVYLLIFLWFTFDQRKKLVVVLIMLIECIILGVLALLVLTLAHTTKTRSTIVGSLAMVANVLMYAAPLSIMKMVILTKSVEYMPLSLSVASFANGICWAIYALLRFDPYVAAPNGLGTLLGLAQLILYATFYRSTKRQMLERQAKGEIGLAETTISVSTPKR